MALSLAEIPALSVTFLFVFARLGMVFLLFPGFSDQVLPVRIRLAIALGTALMVMPIVIPAYRPYASVTSLALVVFLGEILIGGFLGLVARLILVSVQVAGTTAAFQMGFGFAQAANPARNESSLLLETLFTQIALMLFFVLDLHHLLIGGFVSSVSFLPPGFPLDPGSAGEVALGVFTAAFLIGVKLALPFIVFGLVFQAGLAVLSRLMPQLGVFFVAVPLNILFGLALLLFLLPTVLDTFADFAQRTLQNILPHAPGSLP